MTAEPPLDDSWARGPWWRRPSRQVPTRPKSVSIAAAVVLLANLAVAGYLVWHQPARSPTAKSGPTSRQTAQPATPSRQPAAPPVRTEPPRPQTMLPFTGVVAEGVAVDTAGNIYVADAAKNRVLQLAVGSSTPVVLPFTGLNGPDGVAVDAAGNVYVVDDHNKRVLKLTVGSSAPAVLPFNGLKGPSGVAVDGAGNVYVTDRIDDNNEGVRMLAAGSNEQSVLPFEPLGHSGAQVAADSAGNVYVVGYGINRVLTLAPGSTTQTALPITGLRGAKGVAVDKAGNLYIVGTGEWGMGVLKLAAGSASPTLLRLTGAIPLLSRVAVDGAGNVYVTANDSCRLCGTDISHRVIKVAVA